MVSHEISVSRASKKHGGARVGAGRPRLHQRTMDVHSISLADLHQAGHVTLGTATLVLARDGATWNVQITHASCPLGGARPWLHCPRCDRRVGTLYFGIQPALSVVVHGQELASLPEREELACRLCLRLQYASQAESPVSRSYRRTQKLRVGLASPAFVAKPKWMRWPTFQRLCGELDRERELRAEVLDRLECGESERAATLQVQVALDAARASRLTDKELNRAIRRLGSLRRLTMQRH